MGIPLNLQRLAWALALALLVAPITAAGAAESALATLSRTHFPAKGESSAILRVTQAGRYALTAKSKQGTRIQIVDRMAGPAEAAGTAGEQDGRLDLLLDAGTYKVLATSPDQGVGDVSLEVHPFAEMNKPEPHLLIENQPIAGTLDDFHQFSWWIQIRERRVIYLEAQGRNLSSLRLWKDGAWLMDAEGSMQTVDPLKGKPQRSSLLVVDLNPGFYLLTAFGGPALPWAKESGDHPFCLRFGIPQLPNACRMDGVMSSFGTNRYLVPKGANTYILQLTQKKDFRLGFSSFAPGETPGSSESSATIDKKSADPECKIHRTTSKEFALVTISGDPGEPFVFQCFDQQDKYFFNSPKPEDYRITTLHSGYADDSLDATCILIATDSDKKHQIPMADDAIHIGGDKGWARRFNLLDEGTLFFFAEETGDYQIQSSGTLASFRLEPFMLEWPRNYKSPNFEKGSGVFSLTRGYWVLTIRPEKKGILKVALQQKDFFTRMKEWVMGGEELSPTPAKASCTLEKVRLDPDHSYSLLMSLQPEVDHGVLLRSLPLKLEEPIPLTLRPGQEESVAFTASSESRLRVFTLANARFTCILDGSPWTEGTPIKAGAHTVRLRNDASKSLAFTLQGIPLERMADAPPRLLEPATKQALARLLPPLSVSSPVFFDLGVKDQRTARLSVASPGMYRIETTGLLKTALTLRSQVRTKLFTAEANGVGRNALLSHFLKEGNYLVTMQTLDASAGHAGVKATRTEVTTGGELTLDHEAKTEVPANHGVLYTFTVPEEGTYSMKTWGQNRLFPCRLEDSEGWPLVAPGTNSDITSSLPAGHYRFVNLPLDVDTQRLTTVGRVPDQQELDGKGPHPLALNESLKNRWHEAEKGEERQRDVYTLSLPGDLDLALTLGNEQMQGFLKKTGSNDPPVVVPPGKGWSGPLTAGDYRFEVECSRINDLVDYTVLVATDQLAPGMHQRISVPGWLEISLAKDSVVELFSHGQLDVRGLLYQVRPGEVLPHAEHSTASPKPEKAADSEAPQTSEKHPKGEEASEGQEASEGETASENDEPQNSEEHPEGETSAENGEAQKEDKNTEPLNARASLPPPKAGALVDFSDDSYSDWNFRISRRLPAGRYILKVDAVGGKKGKTTIAMAAPEELLQDPLPLDADQTLELGGTIAIFPLKAQSDADLYSVRLTGSSQYGCILERSDALGFVPLITRTGRAIAFDVALQKGASYRLRIWSSDHQSESVRLQSRNTALPSTPVERLADLQALPSTMIQGETNLFARVQVTRGGTFAAEPARGFSFSRGSERALEPTEGGLAALPAGEAILCWKAPKSAPRVRLARVFLGEGPDKLKVRVPFRTRPEMDVKTVAGGPTVVLARTLSGKAACAAFPGDNTKRLGLSRSYALKDDYAMTVIPPGAPGRILLWDPQEEAPSYSEFELQARSFKPLSETTPLTPGSHQERLGANAGRQYELPSGEKQLDLVLEDGLAACLQDGDQVTAVAFAKGETTHNSFPTRATRLLVFNLKNTPAAYELDCRSRSESSLNLSLAPSLTQGHPLERVFSRPGTLRIEVPESATEGQILRVVGTNVGCEWMDSEGILHAGLSHEVRTGGVATLTCGPGLVKAWLSKPGQDLEDRWGPLSKEPTAPLEPNSIAPLEGTSRSFSVAVNRPSALHVRVDNPAAIALRHEASPLAVTEGHPDTALDAYVEPGTYTVDIRGLAAEALRGSIEFTLADVIPIRKTFGPETLIHAGETRTFTFTAKKPDTFGIGLKTDREALDCQLLGINGTPLGTGSQQFVDLAAGTYLLRVSCPPDREPVKFTPVVIGMEPPSSGPPEETLQAFLTELGLEPK